MKAIVTGVGAVLGFLAAVAAFIEIILLWFQACDWIWHKGYPILSAALTPMAFMGYLIIVVVFIAGYAAQKG
jgi:hypothetical protein